MSDDRLQATINRKAKADALLNDAVMIEAWAMLDHELITVWKRTTDPAQRDRIWQATQIAERVQAILRTYVQDGKMAEADLASLIAAQERDAA